MQLATATCNRLKLTPQQEAVVNCLQGPVFVAAGAGSGKTLTVAQRFVNALAKGVATVDQILTITYTEKAAGEMARRIRNQLVKNGMMEQRRLIERAQISTIHSFCAGLIKKYAFQLGLDPEFAVCDQVQADVLKEESFNICLERLMAHHGERAAELLSTCDNSRNPLFKHIADFYDRQRCQGMERPDFNIPQVADPGPLLEELKLKIAEARRSAAVSTSKAKSCFKKIDALAEATVETSWDKMRDLLSANVIGKTTTVKDEILRTSIEAVKEAREKLLAVLNDKRAVPVLKLLRQLLLDFGDEYTARKRQHGLLDFEDLQLQALKLLRDHEDVRRQVAQSYKLVMVDEFQDTNQLQCQLIAQLDRGNVFTVG
jgi:ATP-dependent exoDNAse (exonuclease V) beta subunit